MRSRIGKLIGAAGTAVLAVVLFVSLTSSSAGAQEQDVIGIYFDQEGNSTFFQTTQPGESVYAWLIIKNMSSETGLRYVVAGARLEGAEWTGCWMSLIGPYLLGVCDPDWGLMAGPPAPQTDTLAVVLMWFWVLSPEDVVEIYVQPHSMSPEWQNFAFYQTNSVPRETVILQPSSGSYDLPVAVINGGPSASREGSTWGQIKALYH